MNGSNYIRLSITLFILYSRWCDVIYDLLMSRRYWKQNVVGRTYIYYRTKYVGWLADVILAIEMLLMNGVLTDHLTWSIGFEWIKFLGYLNFLRSCKRPVYKSTHSLSYPQRVHRHELNTHILRTVILVAHIFLNKRISILLK